MGRGIDWDALQAVDLSVKTISFRIEGTTHYISIPDFGAALELYSEFIGTPKCPTLSKHVNQPTHSVVRSAQEGTNLYRSLHDSPGEHEELSDDNLPRHANPARPTPPASHSNVAHMITLEDICRIQQQ
ncbi:hypothetical protein GOBAR_AA03199 [Gossypium barbadense]|uniref:Uncharacterized protein n=1 Tax=Gossypium barbadense TaxID=3634 RepID=A0A2P5YP60_GOSBA|nr:hypothetical protein GOBAR_AA03199 [Gossypium barbadense]